MLAPVPKRIQFLFWNQRLPMPDRRQAKRYQVTAPATYRWISSNSQPHESHGLTRDIGISGVYVLSAIHPPCGWPIELEIRLSNLDNTGPGMRLRGTGTVLRIEQTDENKGFAAAMEFCDEMSLLRLGDTQLKFPQLGPELNPRRRN
jgi:hypothetical protein